MLRIYYFMLLFSDIFLIPLREGNACRINMRITPYYAMFSPLNFLSVTMASGQRLMMTSVVRHYEQQEGSDHVLLEVKGIVVSLISSAKFPSIVRFL